VLAVHRRPRREGGVKMDIKPRIDDDGVGWCDAGCPDGCTDSYGEYVCRNPDNSGRLISFNEYLCPVWTKRMAVENEAWRNGGLVLEGVADECSLDGEWFCTIDEAVDALMKEE